MRRLHQAGYENLLLRTSHELDLRNQAAVDAFDNSQFMQYDRLLV